MAVGSLECSRPRAWPSSCTATKNRSLPGEGGKTALLMQKTSHHILSHIHTAIWGLFHCCWKCKQLVAMEAEVQIFNVTDGSLGGA